MRIQVPHEVTSGWTQVMVFDEPQADNVEVYSAEADVRWNCRRTVLVARDRGYNGHIKAQKSYNMRFVFDGMNGADLDGTFKLFFFNGHPKSVNCYAADYEDDYCGDFVTTTRRPSTRTSPRPTTTTPTCQTPAE